MGAPFDVRIGAFSQSYRAASTEQFFSARPHLEIFFFSAALSLYFFLKILQNYKCGTTLCIILVYIDTRKYWDPISDEPSEWPSCSTLGAPFEVRIEAFDRPYPAASIDNFFSRGPSRCHLKAVVTEAIFFFCSIRTLVVIW